MSWDHATVALLSPAAAATEDPCCCCWETHCAMTDCDMRVCAMCALWAGGGVCQARRHWLDSVANEGLASCPGLQRSCKRGRRGDSRYQSCFVPLLLGVCPQLAAPR